MNWVDKGDFLSLTFEQGEITLEPRPHYCDRGNFVAKIHGNDPQDIDAADCWPRYYFKLEVAKSECEAFVLKRYGNGKV